MANTGNYVPVTVANPTAALVDYDQVRIYRAASETGAGSVVSTQSLASTQTNYDYQDTTGVLTSWYYFTLYNSSSADESQASERMPAANAEVVTLATLVRETANVFGLFGRPRRQHTFPGPSGTTTGAGSTTTTVCSSFISSLWRSDHFQGWALLATSGTESGNWRYVTDGLNTASGTFTHDAFASGVGSGADFDLYGLLAPEEWTECLFGPRGAYLDVWTYVEEAISGPTPDAGDTAQTLFSLPAWFEAQEQVVGLTRYRGTTLRGEQLDRGQAYEVREQAGGGVALYIPAGLGSEQVYYVEGYRRLPKLNARTDTLLLSRQQQRLLVVSAAMRAAQRIEQSLIGGVTADGRAWDRRMNDLEAERRDLASENGAWKRLASPRRQAFVPVAGGRFGPRLTGRSSSY